MRGKLARAEKLTNLSERSYNDIILQLEEYYPNLSKKYAADLSFANLDSALREHLVTQLEKVHRISPQETKSYLKALLAKYDIQVIETVARSLATTGSVTSDVLHRTKLFSKEFITKETHSLDDLRNELKGTKYESLITKYYTDLEQNKLKAFEQELDLLFFKKLLSAANNPSSRGYTKRLIDSHNIALINQGEEALIPGGRILQQSLSKDLTVKQLVELARAHNYTVTDTEDAQILERDMQINIKKYAKQLMKQEPLSPASIIGFVALQAVSVRNTVILLKMKYHDMSSQRITEVLAQ
jgi:vacuolar-type H+-ATPase subunit C/Vma6